MNLNLNDADLNRLSDATRAELAALFFPTPVRDYPDGFDSDDFEDVVDLTPGQIEEFMEGCAAITIAGLRLFAEAGGRIHGSALDTVGIENYGSFQGSVTKRTRTVTRNRNAYLLAWDDWSEAPGGVGHYAVTPATLRSLRIYFKLD